MRSTPSFAAVVALLLASCGGGGSGVTGGSTGTVGSTPLTVSPATWTPGTGGGTGTTVAPPVTTGADAVADVQLGQTGVSTATVYGRLAVTAAAEVTNVSDGYVGRIGSNARLLAADGTVLAEAEPSYLGALAPGATTWLVPSFYGELAATPASLEVELTDAARLDAFTVSGGTMPLVDTTIDVVTATATIDINDQVHIEAELHNPSNARLTQVAIRCGAYTDGRLVGGVYGDVNEIVPGGSAGVNTTAGLTNITPLPSEVRCQASPTISSTYEPGVTGTGLLVDGGLTYNPAGGQGRWYDVELGVTVSNPTDRAAMGVEVEADLLDTAGRVVDVSMPSMLYVLPGETVYTGSFPVPDRYSDPPASVRVRTTVREWSDPTSASLGGRDGVDLTAVRFDIAAGDAHLHYGTLDVDGTVTNRSGVAIRHIDLTCTAFSGGRIIGGGTTSIDELPVDVAVEFEVISGYSAELPDDAVRCTAHLNAISEVG